MLDLLKRFLIIGGMPEVVEKYVVHNDLRGCQRVLDYLIQRNNEILPVEAKYGCRLSLENFSEYGPIKVFPLYAYTNRPPDITDES